MAKLGPRVLPVAAQTEQPWKWAQPGDEDGDLQNSPDLRSLLMIAPLPLLPISAKWVWFAQESPEIGQCLLRGVGEIGMGTRDVRWEAGSKALTLTYVLDTNSYFPFNFFGAKAIWLGAAGVGGVTLEDIPDNMAGGKGCRLALPALGFFFFSCRALEKVRTKIS